MTVVREYRDAAAFVDEAGAFLLRAPRRNTVILGALDLLRWAPKSKARFFSVDRFQEYDFTASS